MVRSFEKCVLTSSFSPQRCYWRRRRRSTETMRDFFSNSLASASQISRAFGFARIFMNRESGMVLAMSCFTTASPLRHTASSSRYVFCKESA